MNQLLFISVPFFSFLQPCPRWYGIAAKWWKFFGYYFDDPARCLTPLPLRFQIFSLRLFSWHFAVSTSRPDRRTHIRDKLAQLLQRMYSSIGRNCPRRWPYGARRFYCQLFVKSGTIRNVVYSRSMSPVSNEIIRLLSKKTSGGSFEKYQSSRIKI